MIPVTGTRETSTNPVTTVPKIAPAVPRPESRPTTVPVSVRLVSISLTTIGVTAESSAPGTMIVSPATRNSRPPSWAPAVLRTRAGVTATATPETDSSGASTARGETRSAARPPIHAPSAIAASAVPITKVLVSRVSPR